VMASFSNTAGQLPFQAKVSIRLTKREVVMVCG